MNEDEQRLSPLVNTLGDQFRTLVRNLREGNRKKAVILADEAREQISAKGIAIVSQDLIERMAQSQAFRNSLINSPSIVPGIGTILSFAMLSIENFFILDQSVTLILALAHLRGLRFQKGDTSEEEFIIRILGEAFGIVEDQDQSSSGTIIRSYVTETLPRRYVNKSIDRGMRKLMTRILPYRRKSRLLPGGVGLVMSAANAYETLVRVGQSTLKHIKRIQQGEEPPS
ncbi:MAG: hypothetical protein ACP5G0_02275 [Desulfomonilia bacterium]